MDRNKMVALIHAKTAKMYRCCMCGSYHAGPICLDCGDTAIQAPLEGEEYEVFLLSVVGKNSCKDMTDEELEKVMGKISECSMLLEDENRKKVYAARSKLKWVIKGQASKIFGKDAQKRVDGFCEKCIGKPIERCDEKELRKVIGWLRRMEKWSKKKKGNESKMKEGVTE